MATHGTLKSGRQIEVGRLTEVECEINKQIGTLESGRRLMEGGRLMDGRLIEVGLYTVYIVLRFYVLQKLLLL